MPKISPFKVSQSIGQWPRRHLGANKREEKRNKTYTMAKSNVKLALDEEDFFNADKSAKSTDDLAFIEGEYYKYIHFYFSCVCFQFMFQKSVCFSDLIECI
jgi:hypothetical protein